MKSKYLTPALFLMAGIVIGWLIPRNGHEVPVADSPGHGSEGAKRSNHAPDDVGLRWKSKAASEIAGNDRLLTVPSGLLQDISKFPPVQSCRDDLFRRDDAAIELLRITPREKEQLEVRWESCRKKIESLEAQESVSTRLNDGSVSIMIPDLTALMQPIGSDFMGEVRDVVGPERGDLLVNLKQIEGIFSPDIGERDYHIRVEPTGGGRWRYHMAYKDGQNHRVWVGESIPNEIRHITDAASIAPDVSSLNDGP